MLKTNQRGWLSGNVHGRVSCSCICVFLFRVCKPYRVNSPLFAPWLSESSCIRSHQQDRSKKGVLDSRLFTRLVHIYKSLRFSIQSVKMKTRLQDLRNSFLQWHFFSPNRNQYRGLKVEGHSASLPPPPPTSRLLAYL